MFRYRLPIQRAFIAHRCATTATLKDSSSWSCLKRRLLTLLTHVMPSYINDIVNRRVLSAAGSVAWFTVENVRLVHVVSVAEHLPTHRTARWLRILCPIVRPNRVFNHLFRYLKGWSYRRDTIRQHFTVLSHTHSFGFFIRVFCCWMNKRSESGFVFDIGLRFMATSNEPTPSSTWFNYALTFYIVGIMRLWCNI